MEKEFVGGLFKDALTAENAQNELKPGIHWRLDGSDKDVVLYGNASFKQDNDINTAVLDLPGTTGSYATTPAFPISKISFTISMWIKAPNLLSPGLAYSSWGNPHVFALKASWFSARRLHNPKAVHFSIINNNNLPKNQWINVVAV
ncbi:uncharacterized protein LOC110237348 [Exaiptasia diaphana]|uniref:Uncharacterized protein n=1 Tax=Exaiptasia diaphana TaxID=2652724 RepID=A0A913X440_EXADI|nr:uncharacterized protein LOC110237348 [Exaiptasia diaphana]